MSLLQDKVVLVTGAGMGIGRAIAETCAREGAKVVVADIDPNTGAETAQRIQAAGGDALFVAGDVSDEAQVERTVAATIDRHGRLDGACNSAAVSRGSGPIHLYSREVFEQTLEMCLTNTWLCMKHQISAMLERGGGAIVNISSNASLRGQAFNTAYAAAKSGVNLLTKSAAAEYGGKGVRINAVSPGVVRTPGLEHYFKEQPDMRKRLERAAVMGRLGEPQEIAEAVVFLLSDRAAFITGQVLSVDGGAAVR